MTRVSKHKLKENKLQELTEHFTFLVASLQSNKEIENFLIEFLTKEEKMMLSKRLVLLMMIKKGYSSDVIQSALHVSYETVRSYTIQSSLKNDLFSKTIERLVKRQKAQEFWEKVDKILAPIDLALRSGTDMKARAKLYSGDWD